MPVSFWINLIVCIGSIVVAWQDHGETAKGVKSAVGKERKRKLLKLILLWGVPVASLVATLVSAKEAYDSEMQARQQESAFNEATNRLAIAEANQSPRQITAEQRSKLVQCLSAAPKGPVIVGYESLGSGSAEAKDYQSQVAAVLKNAGFWGSKANRLNLLSIGERGIYLLVKDTLQIPPHAFSIQSCFLTNGISPMKIMAKLDPLDAQSMESNIVVVWVSQK